MAGAKTRRVLRTRDAGGGACDVAFPCRVSVRAKTPTPTLEFFFAGKLSFELAPTTSAKHDSHERTEQTTVISLLRPQRGVRSIVITWCLSVCLSVCLSLRWRTGISKTIRPNFAISLPVVSSHGSKGSSLMALHAVRYVLPVLWMTPYFHTLGSTMRHVYSKRRKQPKPLRRFQPNFAPYDSASAYSVSRTGGKVCHLRLRRSSAMLFSLFSRRRRRRWRSSERRRARYFPS